MKESPVSKKFRLNVSRSHPSVRLFRNNVGMGFFGKITRETKKLMSRMGFSLVRVGLIKGSGDLIGWESIEVTPDMVGQRVARFLSVETKRTSGGRLSDEQKNWLDQVNAAGGRAIVVNNPEEYEI